MTADIYLQGILFRESVDTGLASPVRGVIGTLRPAIVQWSGGYLVDLSPSGSFAKGTANKSGTDIDVFVSLAHNTPETLKDIYTKLYQRMTDLGYRPRVQNVSINITVHGYDVDLVPAKRQDAYSQDHSLYRRKADTWTKTNVASHITYVSQSGCVSEARLIKLWRNQKGLDFPSFYLELSVINALTGTYGTLSQNILTVLRYLRDTFPAARIIDPANTKNIISEDLTAAEKGRVKAAAERALAARTWGEIIV